ncbi:MULTISPECIES: hypothetical protein [unclassified Pseudomonas]|jgi:hypothetical protein|uniref:hypothetical protein n=1 Tax=unclassified Pseudomonas TaxID=196821 RepID=UPI00026FA6C7|nr:MULTISPECIES: hypothetical protein [unclassified Pseudomonas]EJN21594.1 hypothetical protein PMI37_05183 [Pseudomonas sp. GM80]KAE9647067.1 hypothetical protein EJA70_06345 [Pseudomonas sp. PB103]
MQKDYVPYGSDVSPGTYECVDCGHQYSNQAKTSMPPCPQFRKTAHALNGWKILTGQGDAIKDPYPEKPADIKSAEVITPSNKK